MVTAVETTVLASRSSLLPRRSENVRMKVVAASSGAPPQACVDRRAFTSRSTQSTPCLASTER